MRKLLMLCYFYPPLHTVGSLRSEAFSRLLPEFGWEPIVLTVSNHKNRWIKLGAEVPASVRVERCPELDLFGMIDLCHAGCCRLFSALGYDLKQNYFRELFCIPDSEIAWLTLLPGVRLAKECDCIYASCSPFSSALSACLIGRITKKPVVLDFRDSWSINTHIPHTCFHSWVVKKMERIVLNEAKLVILNTPGAERAYRESYPELKDKFCCVPNGYDQLNLPERDVKDLSRYRIVHVGSFYHRRSPDLLLSALTELNDPEIEFIQVGSPFQSYDYFKDKLNIQVTGSVPHDEALRIMRSASLLYLKQGFEDSSLPDLAVAAKSYEYLATGVPVLAECSKGDNLELLKQYASRCYPCEQASQEQMQGLIKKAKADWPAVEVKVSEEFLTRYNRRVLTEQLAKLLGACVAGS